MQRGFRIKRRTIKDKRHTKNSYPPSYKANNTNENVNKQFSRNSVMGRTQFFYRKPPVQTELRKDLWRKEVKKLMHAQVGCVVAGA